MSQISVKNCGLDALAHVLAESESLRGVSVSFHEGRIDYAMSGQGLGEKGAVELAEAVRALGGGSVCRWTPPSPSCEKCGRLLADKWQDGVLMRRDGEKIVMERESCQTAPKLWLWKMLSGVKLEVRHLPSVVGAGKKWKVPLILAVICGVAGLCGWWIEGGIGKWLFLAAYLAGGWKTGEEVFHRMKEGVLDIHFLMLAVAAGAAAVGHLEEGALLLFLFSLSGALEELAAYRTEKELAGLFKAAPREAVQVRADGSEERVPVESLEVGMKVRVRPGDSFPVDAEVLDGKTSADESSLTGESAPVDKEVGSVVLAGTLNLWGRVDLQVLRPAKESALEGILRLIREAQEQKAPAQRFTDRFGTRYTHVILSLSLVMFLVWWGMAGWKKGEAGGAFYKTMTLLVVASPCALVLSIPSAVLAGIAAGARRGILFRGGSPIERLGAVGRVALDKTGTLTTGDMKVQGVETESGCTEEQVLQGAAALGMHSLHPVSVAIMREARRRGLTMEVLKDFSSATGGGLQGRTGDQTECKLGRRSFLGDPSWTSSKEAPSAGVTEVLYEAGAVRGRILLEDEIRISSRPLLQWLEKQGLKVTMLTGDREAAASLVAKEVGLKDYRYGLHPEDKVAAIREWGEKGEKVAMVGDGVNDAPSLAAAEIGVAMGARGTGAALAESDVILMRDRLESFAEAYDLSRRTRRVIAQNLFISLGTIAVLVTAALGAVIPLTVGVAAHEGSTVIVVLNSLRLLAPRRGFAGLRGTGKNV
ncbi:MAG: cation-translocating P-type ATPase [Verrucomicrobia bacterium]|nr:cation-translocating P-type ATPase [Verrucomicrobiota bacterium]